MAQGDQHPSGTGTGVFGYHYWSVFASYSVTRKGILRLDCGGLMQTLIVSYRSYIIRSTSAVPSLKVRGIELLSSLLARGDAPLLSAISFTLSLEREQHVP